MKMTRHIIVAGLILGAGCTRVGPRRAVADAPPEDVKAVV